MLLPYPCDLVRSRWTLPFRIWYIGHYVGISASSVFSISVFISINIYKVYQSRRLYKFRIQMIGSVLWPLTWGLYGLHRGLHLSAVPGRDLPYCQPVYTWHLPALQSYLLIQTKDSHTTFEAVSADRPGIVTFWGQHWIEYFERAFLVDRTRG